MGVERVFRLRSIWVGIWILGMEVFGNGEGYGDMSRVLFVC